MLWAAILCWVVAVIGLTLSESLRVFTRSRLLAECKRRGREERFRAILDGDEDATLLCTFVGMFALIAGVVLVAITAPAYIMPDSSAPATVSSVVTWLLLSYFAATVLPWAVARVTSEWLLATLWPAMHLGLTVGKPFVAVARFCDTVLHRLAGRDDPESEVDAISDEIDAVVDEGEREGTIEEGVSQMIQRVVDLQNVDVRDVMTPRTEIVTLPVDTDLGAAKTCFVEAGHSRVPVIGDTPDDMLGVVYAKDLLHFEETSSENFDLRSLLREPLIVPETTAVDQLLERMRSRRMHIAMVLDEYGGVVGLVTLEDILEEIVGDISDEYDPEVEEDELVVIDNRTIEVDARFHIDDLIEQFDYDLPDDGDFETIGGFVFSEMGHVPEQGESIVWKNLEITVLEADKRKISRLRIQQLDTAGALNS